MNKIRVNKWKRYLKNSNKFNRKSKDKFSKVNLML